MTKDEIIKALQSLHDSFPATEYISTKDLCIHVSRANYKAGGGKKGFQKYFGDIKIIIHNT